MIEIRNTKGQVADTYSDTAIAIEKNNPLFNDPDTFVQDVIYTFKLPDTPNNREFFNGGHLIEAANHTYEQQVQVNACGYAFFAGTLTYGMQKDDYNALLKVNLGTVAQTLKTVKVSSIFSDDAREGAITAAFMKDVCENPAAYPYSFFPIYNDQFGTDPNHYLINPWDLATQKFNIPFSSRPLFGVSIYWKLSHYLKNIMKFLGYTPTGLYLQNTEADKIYLFNPRQINVFQNTILGSGFYLPPDLTISEFLKICKDRFNLGFTFNTINKTVIIEQGRVSLVKNKIIDLSQYIASIDEITVPAAKGYSIILKPDEQDAAWIDPTNEESGSFIPTNKLIVGNGEKAIEMESSTLKEKKLTEMTVPAVSQPSYGAGGQTQGWSIRFLRYDGMQPASPGKVYPRAYPVELNFDDAAFYRFLNDSKNVKCTFYIPNGMLSLLDTTEKIGFISRQGKFTVALPQQITYQFTNDSKEFTMVQITCSTLVSEFRTKVSLVPFVAEIDEADSRPSYRAYFSHIPGMQNLKFELYYAKKRTGTSATDGVPYSQEYILDASTDNNGLGGSRMHIVIEDTVRASQKEIRVRAGVPKYIVRNGVRVNFQHRDDYYFVSILENSIDGQGIWIVF